MKGTCEEPVGSRAMSNRGISYGFVWPAGSLAGGKTRLVVETSQGGFHYHRNASQGTTRRYSWVETAHPNRIGLDARVGKQGEELRLRRLREELAQQCPIEQAKQSLVGEPSEPGRNPHETRRAQPATLGPRRGVRASIRSCEALQFVDERGGTSGGQEDGFLFFE